MKRNGVKNGGGKNGTKRPPAPETRTVAVEIEGGIRKRLRMYVAAHEVTIKAVVNEALDEYLGKRGA